jgi:hypothetical protein
MKRLWYQTHGRFAIVGLLNKARGPLTTPEFLLTTFITNTYNLAYTCV